MCTEKLSALYPIYLVQQLRGFPTLMQSACRRREGSAKPASAPIAPPSHPTFDLDAVRALQPNQFSGHLLSKKGNFMLIGPLPSCRLSDRPWQRTLLV